MASSMRTKRPDTIKTLLWLYMISVMKLWLSLYARPPNARVDRPFAGLTPPEVADCQTCVIDHWNLDCASQAPLHPGYTDDMAAAFGQFRIEPGWTITTAENAIFQISFREAKHGNVFFVGTSPRHDFFECKTHR
jgi:hypothetical protein